jgi:plasmid stabilization system protein ParE
MSKAIHRRQEARQDLVDTFRYFAREAGFRVAQRFFAPAEATFARLAGMPGIGTRYGFQTPGAMDGTGSNKACQR